MQCLIDQHAVCMKKLVTQRRYNSKLLDLLPTTEEVGLVWPVHTVDVPVTHPLLGDTGPITAVELRGATTYLTSRSEAENFHVIGYYSHCYTDKSCIRPPPKKKPLKNTTSVSSYLVYNKDFFLMYCFNQFRYAIR